MSEVAVEVEEEVIQKKVSLKESLKEPVSNQFKKTNDLADEEKKKIIADIQSDKENEFFELKEFKNGSYRIVKKKAKSFVD